MTADRENEVYLGDGLYASFDGYTLVLRAPREGGDHWVALEPLELLTFVNFIKAIATEMTEKYER
jgi:hypothetical protein